MNFETFLNGLCTHLGLSDEATFDEILAAVKASRPKLPPLSRVDQLALAQRLYEASHDGAEVSDLDGAPACIHGLWLRVADEAVQALR